MPSSMKTRQARDKLRKINPTWFDNFFKNDLKKLTQKNATANEVIRYAEDEKSNIYAYAQNLIYSVDLGGNSMTDFKTAIELQSQSFSTKHEGLFYKLIVNQRSELTNLKSNPEKPGKLPQIKSKIKAFLLATNEKEKDIIDEDVSEEDKKFKRMNNSSIIQKLKSSRLSNVLKVFMALVFWDCIKIVEKEIKSKKEQAEEENKRQAQKETERRLKDKKQRQAQEEAIAEQERQRQARETAEEQKKKDDERKLALKDWLENQSKRIEDTFKIPDTIDDQSIETFFSSANSLKIELRADLGFDTLYVDRGNRSFKVDFPQIEKDALNKKLNDEAKQKITELLKAFMKKIGFDDALGELKTLLDTKDITSVSRSDVINKQFALRRKIDLVKPLFKYKMTTEWNLSTSWSEIITPAEDTCASADAFLTRQEKAKKEAEKIATAENRRKQVEAEKIATAENRRKQVEAGRKALEERKKQAETHHQEIEKLIKDQEPNHAAYIKLINELFDATSPTFDEKRACELYNKLGFAECDDPEDISRYIGDIASALDFSSRCYASCVNDVKKLIAELLWLNHLAYDRFGTLQLMHGGDQYVNKIVRALLEYGGASRNKKEYKKYFDYRLAYPLQLTDIQNLRENYLNPMGTVFGSNFRALSEVLVALMPQKLIQTKTNSSNKMGNILATFEKLNDALNSIKGGNASFKIIAEAFQKISIEPLIDKIKEIIEKMKRKEK
ncbi:MAG: hypothetical protein Q4D57_04455 [Clostridia bacterium]|nr:hypothetical protein [Clostridia bacterium]